MDKLTIFYNKRTGTIKESCGGEQDMSYFGNEEQDYALIFDYIIVDNDQYVIQNIDNMEILDGTLKVRESAIPKKYI